MAEAKCQAPRGPTRHQRGKASRTTTSTSGGYRGMVRDETFLAAASPSSTEDDDLQGEGCRGGNQWPHQLRLDTERRASDRQTLVQVPTITATGQSLQRSNVHTGNFEVLVCRTLPAGARGQKSEMATASVARTRGEQAVHRHSLGQMLRRWGGTFGRRRLPHSSSSTADEAVRPGPSNHGSHGSR